MRQKVLNWSRNVMRLAAPPSGSSPADANASRRLASIVQLASLCSAVYIVVLWITGAQSIKLLAPALIAVAGVVSGYLRLRTSPKTAFAVFIGFSWIAVALQSAYVGGLHNPVLQINTILVTLCGWFIGLPEAGLLLAVSIVWIFGLHWHQALVEVHEQVSAPPASQVFAMTAIWIASYCVMRLVLTEHSQRLARIRELESTLGEKRLRLDEQMTVAQSERQKVAQLLSASPLPITVANLHTGVYMDVNPAWERFFGYSLPDVRGKTSVDLGFWKDMTQRQGWIDQFNAEGRVSGYEVRFQLRDGRTRDFLLSSERFFYGDEESVLTMSVDITERKQLENELRLLNATLETRVTERTLALEDANRELISTLASLNLAQAELIQSEKLASLGSLVAGLSHEINTPIGNALVTATSIADEVSQIKGRIEQGSLRKSEFSSFIARQEEGSALILRSLQRAAHLISSFKQVAVDQTTEQRRDFDVAITTKEIIDTQIPGLKQRGISVQLDMQHSIVVDSYPGPYGQVLMNCVNNALMHAFEGIEAPQITLTLRPQGEDAVRIDVTDNGVGIAPDLIGRVFDPFFTTKMGKGGSGIGLAISHRLVTSVLGGSISVQSTVGRGTTFSLVFPTKAPSGDVSETDTLRTL